MDGPPIRDTPRSYEILSPLGAGGMGEVYKATDQKLGRQVAIKVLPEELAQDSQRLQRFEREARAASALNHPNTVTIHDIDEHEGVRYIAMELVEGRTLRDRLGAGALPIPELVGIAGQIAQGLAKAHAAGIVHRDLKPGNIMLTDDGLVKILDFGLAKLSAPSSDPGSELSTAAEITRAGVVLGTAPYMSPEQAAGRPVDHRSDQFSVGAILYEMATGQRAFEKDTAAETQAAVIEAEPTPVAVLKSDLPPPVIGVIERCLSKDPRGRYDSTGDLAKELARALAFAPGRRLHVWWAVAGLVALGAIVSVFSFWRSSEPEVPQPVATPMIAVPLTSYQGSEEEPTFSPDGSQVAFSWDGERRDNRDVYVKAIGSDQALRLTTDPAEDGSPAWSPDGGQIAFLRSTAGGGSEVIVVPPTGGPERRLADVGGAVNDGLAWSPDSHTLAVIDRSTVSDPAGVVLLDVDGGSKRSITSPDRFRDQAPAFSPDGKSIAFLRYGSQLHVVSVDGGKAREIGPGRSRVVWSNDGRELIFSAVPDMAQAGAVRPSAAYGSDYALWRTLEADSAKQMPGAGNAWHVALSRSGDRLAYSERTRLSDIWHIDLRPESPRRFVAQPLIASTRIEANPRFSPDGRRIVFTGMRSGHSEIWVSDADGTGALRVTSLGRTGNSGSPSWSPDGGHIAFDFMPSGADGQSDIYVVGASGGAVRRITSAESSEHVPTWSRDGQWIYFASDRSGRWQVWKVPSSGESEGSAMQVTHGGGFLAIESTDGTQVFYSRRRSGSRDLGDAIWTVPVGGGEERPVIESFATGYGNWDVAGGGIYFVDSDDANDEKPWVVKRFSLDQGEVDLVFPLPHQPVLGPPSLSVSFDGREAIYWRHELSSDLMLVENFR